MEGSATPTIETSSPSRKTAPQTAKSRPHVAAVQVVFERCMAARIHASAYIAYAKDANAIDAAAWYNPHMPTTRDDPKLVGAWRELLDRHARAHCALERALSDEHGLGVSEFEVLDRLAADDKEGRRIQ